MESKVYIVMKDWIGYSICGTHRIISEFTINNTTLDIEVQNCKKLAPKKVEVNTQQNKITLFI